MDTQGHGSPRKAETHSKWYSPCRHNCPCPLFNSNQCRFKAVMGLEQVKNMMITDCNRHIELLTKTGTAVG